MPPDGKPMRRRTFLAMCGLAPLGLLQPAQQPVGVVGEQEQDDLIYSDSVGTDPQLLLEQLADGVTTMGGVTYSA